MNLIQYIKNLFKKRDNDSEQKPQPTQEYNEFIRRDNENIRKQLEEDTKWEMRIRKKATQRYYELTNRKSGIPIIDSTRYLDTYTIYHPMTARYSDGIEKEIQNRLSIMLRFSNKIPKNTIPRI